MTQKKKIDKKMEKNCGYNKALKYVCVYKDKQVNDQIIDFHLLI